MKEREREKVTEHRKGNVRKREGKRDRRKKGKREFQPLGINVFLNDRRHH